VRLDEPGEDDLAGGVQDIHVLIERAAHLHDGAVADQDVGRTAVSPDLPATDE
jgi:hypothetical protein